MTTIKVDYLPPVALRDLFPPAMDDGQSWAHQRSAQERRKHRERTEWVGERGRTVADERRRVRRGV